MAANAPCAVEGRGVQAGVMARQVRPAKTYVAECLSTKGAAKHFNGPPCAQTMHSEGADYSKRKVIGWRTHRDSPFFRLGGDCAQAVGGAAPEPPPAGAIVLRVCFPKDTTVRARSRTLTDSGLLLSLRPEMKRPERERVPQHMPAERHS